MQLPYVIASFASARCLKTIAVRTALLVAATFRSAAAGLLLLFLLLGYYILFLMLVLVCRCFCWCAAGLLVVCC